MTSAEVVYDYFISYASTDEPYAVWLDSLLRGEGHATIMSAFDFYAGDNFVLQMSHAVEKSRCTILLWSSDAAGRSAVHLEWTSAMIDRLGSVIPVLLDDTHLPHLLRPSVRIDLRGVADDATAKSRVMAGIRGVDRPTSPVPFPRDPSRSDYVAQPVLSLDSRLRPRADQESFPVIARGHKVFWLAAKGFEAFLHQYETSVRSALTSGAHFRFLMHNPDNEVLMSMMAALSYGNRDPARIAERLREASGRIADLEATFEGQVEFRVTDWLLSTGYTLCDPEGADGRLYIEFFGFRVSLGERMTLLALRRREPKFFEAHYRSYQTQWRNGQPWRQPQKGTST